MPNRKQMIKLLFMVCIRHNIYVVCRVEEHKMATVTAAYSQAMADKLNISIMFKVLGCLIDSFPPADGHKAITAQAESQDDTSFLQMATRL